MSKIADKITTLENLLEGRERKLYKKIRNSIIIYIVLVIFVIAYTSFVVTQIKKMTTVEYAFEIIKGTMSEHTTTLRNKGIEKIKANSDMWATNLVQQIVDIIPLLEKPIIAMFDDMTNYIVLHVEHVLVPAFTATLRENSAELKARYNDFEDEEKMQGLSYIFVEIFENEMDKYINAKFVSEVFNLQKKLRELSSNNVKLTKKEDAQRRILINWMYLTDNAEFSEGPLNRLVDKLARQLQSLIGNDEGEEEFEMDGVDISQEL
jgi:hypothetical protein